MLNWVGRLYLWACHRLYNELAWAYDWVSWVVSLGHWWGWRTAALDYLIGPRVLEVGFGTGDLLIEMARQGWDVHGLDLSPAMHRIMAHKMRRCGVWAPRVRGLVQAMPFPDRAFHSIVSTCPAEFILQPSAWREFGRVLASGGRVIVTGTYLYADNPLLQQVFRIGKRSRGGRESRLPKSRMQLCPTERTQKWPPGFLMPGSLETSEV